MPNKKVSKNVSKKPHEEGAIIRKKSFAPEKKSLPQKKGPLQETVPKHTQKNTNTISYYLDVVMTLMILGPL